MTQLEALLLSAIGALVAAIVFLYFDKKSEAKSYAKSLKERDDAFIDRLEKTTSERDGRFTTVIKESTKLHQEQEDELHKRHEKAISEMVADHKKEMSGMVDRAIEAFKNDKEHDRDERERILTLAESLTRRARSKP